MLLVVMEIYYQVMQSYEATDYYQVMVFWVVMECFQVMALVVFCQVAMVDVSFDYTFETDDICTLSNIDLYTLPVEENDNSFANNVFVHNKAFTIM